MVEWCWGSALLFDRQRWPTADGYIPYRLALLALTSLPRVSRSGRSAR